MIHRIKWVKKKLKKLFSYLFGKNKAPKYVQPIIDAASNKGYVESYSNKTDSLHLDIKKKIYEEDLQETFLKLMNKLAPHFRKTKVRLAVDFQEQGFYGKTDKLHIIETSYNGKSYPKAFKFVTISVLTGNKEERIPLFALPWHIGQDLTESIALLLSTVKPWLGKIEVVQFDRGFFSKELIYFLTENKFPYLIHIPCYGKYSKELIKETKNFHHEKYPMKLNVNKSTYKVESNLYVCKDIEKKDWLFLSSLKFNNKWGVRNMYRNRWQIETNYAVHNSARIMSRSADYVIRYFYYLVDVLLQVLWRLCASKIPFRTFLFSMVIGVEKMLMKKPNFAGT
ncbi:MAG: transposase [Candidatus Woesearchaeota archaeon]